MIEIQGTHATAKIFTDILDSSSEGQIKALCNQPFVSGCKIRMMPDVHAGKGCVIGTTVDMAGTTKICPSMVGVDIGCGMLTVQLKDKRIDFGKLDKLIHAEVPAGFNVRSEPHRFVPDWIADESAHVNRERAQLSIGTLGGGNHFIEIDKDDEGSLYLVIHSGTPCVRIVVTEFKKLLTRGKTNREIALCGTARNSVTMY